MELTFHKEQALYGHAGDVLWTLGDVVNRQRQTFKQSGDL